MTIAQNLLVYTTATQFRIEHKYLNIQPICIFDAVVQHGVDLHFKCLSQDDGMLCNAPKPTIVISSLRPFTRQVFTCAHELAHYIFDLKGINTKLSSTLELYENMFAGFVLMPEAAVRYILKEMEVNIKTLTPSEVFKIACWFGVSTNALVTQLYKSYSMITNKQYEVFKNLRLRDFYDAMGVSDEVFCMVFINKHWSERPLDLLIDDAIYAPPEASVLDKSIVAIMSRDDKCCMMKATMVGITNITFDNRTIQVRVSSREYCGEYKNRYLEGSHV